jgi:hypothetical protein
MRERTLDENVDYMYMGKFPKRGNHSTFHPTSDVFG